MFELFGADAQQTTPPAASAAGLTRIQPTRALLPMTGVIATACIDLDDSGAVCGYDPVACETASAPPPAATESAATAAACCAGHMQIAQGVPEFCSAAAQPAVPPAAPPRSYVCQQPIADSPFVDIELAVA